MINDMMKNKNIILGVTGGIAAYKSVELLRLLVKNGAMVRVIMTDNAKKFVTPLTFEALSGNKVCTGLFEKTDDASIRHINWAQKADAVVVAPATANFIGKTANGIADDALTTFILAVICPLIVCPSMNTNMFQNRAVQRNMDILKSDGHIVMEPGAGELACGTTGPGRLPEPETIYAGVLSCLSPKDLSGKTVLVTAGPTCEPIDPVRFIGNPSSGKMGFAIARAAGQRGAKVILISGPTHLPDPDNISVIRVQTAGQMADAVFKQSKQADIVIKAAAVSDYRPVSYAKQKIKKEKDELVLTLEKNPDILKELGKRKKGRILVGFAAETEHLNKYAEKKLAEKNLDMIAGNLVGSATSGFASDDNKITLFYKDGTKESLPVMGKDKAAHILLDRILKIL